MCGSCHSNMCRAAAWHAFLSPQALGLGPFSQNGQKHYHTLLRVPRNSHVVFFPFGARWDGQSAHRGAEPLVALLPQGRGLLILQVLGRPGSSLPWYVLVLLPKAHTQNWEVGQRPCPSLGRVVAQSLQGRKDWPGLLLWPLGRSWLQNYFKRCPKKGQK